MAVPNTTTFSMQDVDTEIDPPTSTPSLTQLITSANSIGEWDSDYSGSKNSLLNFRNYGATSRTMFTIDNSYSYGNASSACTLGTGTTLRNLWHTGSGTYPSVGDTIYQQATGTNNFTPQQFNYIPAGNRAMGINSSGVVTNITLC